MLAYLNEWEMNDTPIRILRDFEGLWGPDWIYSSVVAQVAHFTHTLHCSRDSLVDYEGSGFESG